MRSGNRTMVLAVGLLWAFGLTGDAFSDMGGTNVDLAVRQVTVTPVRAYVGDKVRVEVLIENKSEGAGTNSADVYANKKVVGSQLFSWGASTNERLYRLTFEWDTRGVPPGEYKIRGEAYVREDTSPFDNLLEVTQPVVLLTPGGTFPGGAAAGGSATETDPRFKEK
jgi:hypothetical protein